MLSRLIIAWFGPFLCFERNGKRYTLHSRCDLAGCRRYWRCERNGRRYALRSRLIIAWFGPLWYRECNEGHCTLRSRMVFAGFGRYLCCERDAGHCFLRSERDSVKDGGCRCGERQIAGWICLSCWCVALLLPQAASGAGAGVVLSRFAVYSRSGGGPQRQRK